MIHTQTRTQPDHRTMLIGAVLAGGVLVGFVIGQAVPGALEGILPAAVERQTPAIYQLSNADDFALRHAGGAVPLTDADDFALRHAPALPVLGDQDDYGLRRSPGD